MSRKKTLFTNMEGPLELSFRSHISPHIALYQFYHKKKTGHTPVMRREKVWDVRNIFYTFVVTFLFILSRSYETNRANKTQLAIFNNSRCICTPCNNIYFRYSHCTRLLFRHNPHTACSHDYLYLL